MLAARFLQLTVLALVAGCALAQPHGTPRGTPRGTARGTPALGGDPSGANSAALPVREVTVFKDGHAFVLREEVRNADEAGRVVLDDLPEPVLGTFWPYASGGAQLLSATAARESVSEEHPAYDMEELLRASIGREVALIDLDGARIEGKLIGLSVRPTTDDDENDGDDPRNETPRTPSAPVVRIATKTGTRALPVARVREFETHDELAQHYTETALRERLTLRVDKPHSAVTVGVAYVQKGLRWIPAYRLDLGKDGKAAVRLEATLVNDLVDLSEATVHLVVGAPRFEFAGELDPIAMRTLAAGIGARAQPMDRFSNLPNSLTTQSAAFMPAQNAPSAPEPVSAQGEEDLYLFTLRGVTLKKGERLVLPLSEFTLPYRDVYVLEVPFGPPGEMREQASGERALELARLLAAPKAMHTLRLENTSDAPLTTAPALVLSNGLPLAQGRMLYTPSGTRTDLTINAAVDVRVELDEHESGRKPERLLDDDYQRTTITGAITLTNEKREPIELEVRRHVLGLVDEVGQGGVKVQRGLAGAWGTEAPPDWWGWYSWPYWCFRLNGVGDFSWTTKLEPRASVKLEASWHYFWR